MSPTNTPAPDPGVGGSDHPASLGAPGCHAGAMARLDLLYQQIEARFREAVAEEIRRSHAAGVPTATLDARGSVVWRYPDGTERTALEPVR